MTTARQIVLASRPKGAPTAENFRTEEVTLPQVGDGELELKVQYLSLDPYMRGRMSAAKSYAAPVPVDGVMQGETVAEVTVSRHPDFEVGDLVQAHTGWCTHAVVPAKHVWTLQTHGAPSTTALGVLGMPGFTAYAGMKVIGQPKKGETVAVAAASGPVGSMVGQLAQLAGARAVGIAGGPEKCAFVRDELGFDAVVDHRDPDFADKLAEACPDGVDVYYENVGGAVWDAVLPLLNKFARVPVCGLVSQYNSTGAGDRDRLPAAMGTILAQSVLIRGFIQTEFAEEYYPEFLAEVGPKVADGTINYREQVVEGFDTAPDAFIGMLEGKNFGKLVVKVD
ncbi:NADP-dependent oxidoreductase [Corynebacterium glyciniphilum]|uniref:NADP-dependent oxidoreductase n=1 Tax=Corynebacterium glyciniphilum TaxID=1404244 RepID=UPI0011AB8073|nr:NADP-dependent oxidoreductase [Corynebacterium glyciniphilum]